MRHDGSARLAADKAQHVSPPAGKLAKQTNPSRQDIRQWNGHGRSTNPEACRYH
jgi:hypothetical protein